MLFFIWYRITPTYDSRFAKTCDTLLIGAKETKWILFIKHNRISLSQKNTPKRAMDWRFVRKTAKQ